LVDDLKKVKAKAKNLESELKEAQKETAKNSVQLQREIFEHGVTKNGLKHLQQMQGSASAPTKMTPEELREQVASLNAQLQRLRNTLQNATKTRDETHNELIQVQAKLELTETKFQNAEAQNKALNRFLVDFRNTLPQDMKKSFDAQLQIKQQAAISNSEAMYARHLNQRATELEDEARKAEEKARRARDKAEEAQSRAAKKQRT